MNHSPLQKKTEAKDGNALYPKACMHAVQSLLVLDDQPRTCTHRARQARTIGPSPQHKTTGLCHVSRGPFCEAQEKEGSSVEQKRPKISKGQYFWEGIFKRERQVRPGLWKYICLRLEQGHWKGKVRGTVSLRVICCLRFSEILHN